MRLSLLLSCILLIIGFSSCTRKVVEQLEASISETETRRILTYLASDSLEGRKPGSLGFQKASDFTISFLKKESISPFYTTYEDTVKYESVISHNILGLIGNKNRKKPHVLIGAHIDHLGLLPSGIDSVYNGANDNASGVTAVLQIAKYLSAREYKKYNIIIALFTGEEDGLVGSVDLAKRFREQNINLDYVINFDMIGATLTDKPEQVYATGYLKSDMAEVLNRPFKDTLVTRFTEEHRYGIFYRSDNYAFYKELNVPAHTFSTFDFKNFDHYHKPQDEVTGIDFENLNKIITKMAQAIDTALSNESKVSLTETN